MSGHIYIYGEIGNWQSKESEDYGVVSLTSVVNAINNNKDAEELIVHIHSVGGDVYEGLAIYDALKSSGKKIITRNEGLCASIATVIYLAGEDREATPNSQFMIHNAWTFAMGDANEMEKTREGLQKYNDVINKIYTDNTNLTSETAKALMDAETEFNLSEALENGFVTKEIKQLKAVAKINTKNMSFNLEDIKKGLGLSKKPEVKNVLLTLADGTNVESDSEESAPKVGDKITDEEGNNVPDGEHELQSGEVITTEGGLVTEVKEVEEEIEEVDEVAKENEELKAEVSALKSDIEGLNAKLTDFNETKEVLMEAVKTVNALKASSSKEINTESKEFEGKKESGIRERSLFK